MFLQKPTYLFLKQEDKLIYFVFFFILQKIFKLQYLNLIMTKKKTKLSVNDHVKWMKKETEKEKKRIKKGAKKAGLYL